MSDKIDNILLDKMPDLVYILTSSRAISSDGRALEWHSRGQRFDPAMVHHTPIKRRFYGGFSFA